MLYSIAACRSVSFLCTCSTPPHHPLPTHPTAQTPPPTLPQDIAARAERGQERAQSAKNHRAADMGGKSAALRDLRLARNRLVNRAHERLAREHNKQKGDDRAMRLEALKARCAALCCAAGEGDGGGRGINPTSARASVPPRLGGNPTCAGASRAGCWGDAVGRAVCIALTGTVSGAAASPLTLANPPAHPPTLPPPHAAGARL